MSFTICLWEYSSGKREMYAEDRAGIECEILEIKSLGVLQLLAIKSSRL